MSKFSLYEHFDDKYDEEQNPSRKINDQTNSLDDMGAPTEFTKEEFMIGGKKRKRGESFFTPLVDNSYGQNTPSEDPPSLLLTPEKPEKPEKSEKYTRGPLVTPENSPPNPKKSPPRRTTYEIKLRF